MGAMANNSTASYVSWEEMVVSSEKGRREVHYYLKCRGGGRDLVVVGKEKGVRHMSYRYTIKDNKCLLSSLKHAPRLKLRSRREVIDWLNSILSDEWPNRSVRQFGGDMENKLDNDIVKDVQTRELGQYGTEFTWLGSSWTCRKRRRHYQSFCRNGAVISAQDFVYVLAEEDKRLVAYLEDMYEDARGNKMVVVRWFHKIDEVGFVLPRNYNDREIFFSLCLQDLSIECIDGLATVLSPEHYEKFINEATRMGLTPFVCYRQFDNDDVKPFDITCIKGYWKQEILRNTASVLEMSDDDLKSKGSLGDAIESRPTKRIRWSKECDSHSKSPEKREALETSLPVCVGSSLDAKGGMSMGNFKEGGSHVPLSRQDNATQPKSGHLTIGSHVEVLSQDSGIRGCWFRALIIKKHKDKVKVQYKDIKDAVDESKNLEEWILPSRLAAPDAFGIRLSGRSIVRPALSFDKGSVPGVLGVGNVVDARWHDGWWEGIVVKKESDDRLIVYFPGEKKEQIFNLTDLRHSKEWFDNRWESIVERSDLVSAHFGVNKNRDIDQDGTSSDNNRELVASIHNDTSAKVNKIIDSMVDDDNKIPNVTEGIIDLSKHLLAHLRWGSSGKRRRSRSPLHKMHFGCNNSVDRGLNTFEKFFISSSLKFDSDNCKYASDPHFSSSVVSSLSNLVMSR